MTRKNVWPTLDVSATPRDSDLGVVAMGGPRGPFFICMNDEGEIVATQLGRPPRGSWTVARRCACGLPMVIETEPQLDDATPFPTRYWLTCKKLNAAIGRLEASGSMESINRRLRGEPVFQDALRRSTIGYLADRSHLLGGDRHPGGGPERVKCLHAHVAHQLITGDNPVGAQTLAELGWEEPEEPCVEVSK